jgi:hypothetical protein
VEADFQITPMLAQEVFGLVQGCILGRMRCPYGLTTNGPDYNELLCHLTFPEPMRRPFGWSNQTHQSDLRPTIRLINFFRSSCRFAQFPSQEQAASQQGIMKGDSAQKAAGEPILGRLYASAPLNSENSQRTGR